MNKRGQVPGDGGISSANQGTPEETQPRETIWGLNKKLVVYLTIAIAALLIIIGIVAVVFLTGEEEAAKIKTPEAETGVTDTGVVSDSQNLTVTPECIVDDDCFVIYGADLACLSGFCYERNVTEESLECVINNDCLFLGQDYSCIRETCYPPSATSGGGGGGGDGGTTPGGDTTTGDEGTTPASEGFFGFFQSSP